MNSTNPEGSELGDVRTPDIEGPACIPDTEAEQMAEIPSFSAADVVTLGNGE